MATSAVFPLILWVLCFVSPPRCAFEAPVVNVTLEKRGPKLLCGSEAIFSRPALTWTFSPEPPDEPWTRVTQSETGLFSVFSSVNLNRRPPHEYICNISTEHSWRSITYRRNRPVRSSRFVKLPCTKPTAPVKSLVWKFSDFVLFRTGSEPDNRHTIVTRTGSEEPVFRVPWPPFVDGLTESNALVLDMDMLREQLVFYCEIFTETETYVSVTEVIRKDFYPGMKWCSAHVPVLRGRFQVPDIIIPLSFFSFFSIFIIFIIITILVIAAFCLWRHRKVSKKQSHATEKVKGERAAPKPADQEKLPELEKLTKPSDKFEFNFEDSDVGSFNDSSLTGGSDATLESSGYGKSECGRSMDSPVSF